MMRRRGTALPDLGAHDSARRLDPKPWDHDFVLMRQMAAAFRSLAASHLAGSRDLTIVDFGCGSMPYRPLFASLAGKYIGADLPQNRLADVAIGEDGRLPLADGAADVVISAQVLEHIPDVSRYLGECRRVLRAGGTLLLSTHGTWIYHPHPTDVRRWTSWGLRFDVGQAGFNVVEVRACLGPLAYTSQVRLLLVVGLLRKFGIVGRVISWPIAVLSQGVMWLEEQITPAWLRADNASVYVVAARRE